MYSRFVCVWPETPEGKFTLMPFICTWLKLTIMKLASRKNMMSISGMISIRARFFGIGEETRILVRRARHGERDRYLNFCHTSRFESPAPKRAYRCIIQNGIADALSHGRVRDAT